MPLRLALEVDRPEILVQGDPYLILTIVNEGPEGATFEHPWYSETQPRFRALNLKTGGEIAPVKGRKGMGPPSTMTLAPGKSLVSYHSFRMELPVAEQGDYEVCAEFEGTVSPPARIRLRPAVPRSLHLDTVQGIVSYGVWVNLAADPPEIVRSEFEVGADGGVVESLPVAKVSASTRPLLSLPPNLGTRRQHWIAWMEQRTLHFTHLSPELGPMVPAKLEIGDCKLIPPLFGEAVEDTSVRTPGWALTTGGEVLAAIRLTEQGAAVGPKLRLPTPEWAMSHARSDQKRFLTTIEASTEKPALSRIGWSNSEIAAPKILANWEGKFIAAGAVMDLEDCVRGAVLLARGDRRILRSWTLDPEDKFQEGEAAELPKDAPASEARVAVAPTGRAVVLARDRERWSIVDGGVRPLAPPAGTVGLPMEVAWLGGFEPAFLCGDPGRGWRIARADGSPLPRRPF